MSPVRLRGMVVVLAAALSAGAEAQRRTLPFGLKAGHHAVRVETALWTPQDSGRYPVVLLTAGGPAALELPLSEYLASHGFSVVRAPRTTVDSVARQFGDSTPVALVTWETERTAAATVTTAAATLSIRTLRPSAFASGRLRVIFPGSASRPGAEARAYRSLCAVTQAILNAMLEGAHPTLSELADRLRAAGVPEAYIRAS